MFLNIILNNYSELNISLFFTTLQPDAYGGNLYKLQISIKFTRIVKIK